MKLKKQRKEENGEIEIEREGEGDERRGGFRYLYV